MTPSTSDNPTPQRIVERALDKGVPRHLFTLVQTLSRLVPAPREAGAQPATVPLHFKAATSLCFEAQDVCDVRVLTGVTPAAWSISSAVLGLLGTRSPLPQALTHDALHADAPSLTTHLFAAVHHRLMQHLVERYRQTHPAPALRRDYTDGWSRRLLAWAPHLRDVPAGLRWRYLRMLNRPKLGAVDLTAVLRDALQQRGIAAQLRVRPMTGGWVVLDAGETCVLGRAKRTLGQGSVMGQRAFSAASAYALDIEPRTAQDLQALWTRPEVAQELQALLGAMGPLQTRCDVHVLLEPCMASATRLGRGQALGGASFLGRPKHKLRIAYTGARFTRAKIITQAL